MIKCTEYHKDMLWDALENIPAFVELKTEDKATIIDIAVRTIEKGEKENE